MDVLLGKAVAEDVEVDQVRVEEVMQQGGETETGVADEMQSPMKGSGWDVYAHSFLGSIVFTVSSVVSGG